MAEPDLRDELGQTAPETGPEPLLPIERKLIAWSLGLGIGLLVLLAALNRLIG